VLFGPALKFLKRYVVAEGMPQSLAYHNEQYSRDAAPLLDELGSAIDHLEAYSKGGAHDSSNFVTACSRCNAKKGTSDATGFAKRNPRPKVRAKNGEPTRWDGFAAYFVVEGRRSPGSLTLRERNWLKALEEYLGGRADG
jgi:hypothetical protein